MMWIAGVSPLSVFEAIIAASVALLIFGIPAAKQQQAYSPIISDAPAGVAVDWARVFIVAFILVLAIVANVVVNTHYTELADSFPFIGVAVWIALLLCVPLRRPRLVAAARRVQGQHLPALAGAVRVDDAGGTAAGSLVADGIRPGLHFRGAAGVAMARRRAVAQGGGCDCGACGGFRYRRRRWLIRGESGCATFQWSRESATCDCVR